MISTILIVMMVVTLIPPVVTANTNVYLGIQTYKTSSSQPANPTPVTSRLIDLEVDYTLIPASEMSKVYYEVFNVNKNDTKVVKDNLAINSSTQSGRLTFQDVELSEGLNRITIV